MALQSPAGGRSRIRDGLPWRQCRADRMKARNFRYIRPKSRAEACRILADAGGDALPLAGGQSLLAGLNMRLSAPRLLVDIADLDELRGQAHDGEVVRLGALTRHN